jgi:hypothetical protein
MPHLNRRRFRTNPMGADAMIARPPDTMRNVARVHGCASFAARMVDFNDVSEATVRVSALTKRRDSCLPSMT